MNQSWTARIGCFFVLGMALANAQSSRVAARPLITEKIDETRLVTLPGNVRSAAQEAGNDRGMVRDDLRLEHMLLLLERPAEREAALEQRLQEQTTAGSAHYHQWLTPAAFGTAFGPSTQDTDAVTHWLASSGFTVNQVYPSGVLVDFSGTAGQVRAAFHTELHTLAVNGVAHIANMQDPQLPAALAPAVAGIISLHDFRPHAMHQAVAPASARAVPAFSVGQGQVVVPEDLATIYSLKPLFAAGISGQGQTIAVIENTNVYSPQDWTTFRSRFGLSPFTGGSFTQVHPGANCSNPGVLVGNDGEAILDAEWATAAAPSATIELASCADTALTFGGLLALENLVNGTAKPPSVVSISYGECEAENGAAANAAYNATYQQAAAEGVSVFVAAGDEGAASCDANQSRARHGIAVSGLASTPYNVAVGGTDFGDAYAGATAQYWSSANDALLGSAKSYIPEIVWNDSCAGALLAKYEGSASTTGKNGFCNTNAGRSFWTTAAGSGGPSNCAIGAAQAHGVASGTCKGYPKPSWQTATPTVPADGVRDLPDVSLFAANGLWGHYYVYCYSDIAGGGASCANPPQAWSGAGGTSFSTPILAAFQALVNQYVGSSQGNPNPTYYKLAVLQASLSNGNTLCNSSASPNSACVFYDVTAGDMDVNCASAYDCYQPSGMGALSTSTTAYAPAFTAGFGYDYATGLGTVNATNLVINWTRVSP